MLSHCVCILHKNIPYSEHKHSHPSRFHRKLNLLSMLGGIGKADSWFIFQISICADRSIRWLSYHRRLAIVKPLDVTLLWGFFKVFCLCCLRFIICVCFFLFCFRYMRWRNCLCVSFCVCLCGGASMPNLYTVSIYTDHKYTNFTSSNFIILINKDEKNRQFIYLFMDLIEFTFSSFLFLFFVCL